MNIKDEDIEWREEAPILAALPRITPFRVPDNYFNDLTGQLNAVVFLNGLTEKDGYGFSVPSDYFESLNAQIKSQIAIEQLKSNASTDGFKTPANYFDKLQTSILDQTVNAKPAPKVVRFWNADIIRYAAAACFILLTATGLYLNQQSVSKAQAQSTELASEVMLYDIDESVIIEHLKESQTATNTSASQAEMESYILDHYSSTDISNNL